MWLSGRALPCVHKSPSSTPGRVDRGLYKAGVNACTLCCVQVSTDKQSF